MAVRLDSPGPVFYKQERVGKGGRPFTIYKFRTMVTNAEQYQHELVAIELRRLTRPHVKNGKRKAALRGRRHDVCDMRRWVEAE